ncbi:uncharacterized protein si:ch211-191i18.2 isoform X2 [Hippoglossus hippoglossus]|uniref:uncharacterized protein si:ch211-191i18.2 isoform X2 n=1 Tax=Hippoglossus hippoglossus TaxID=8267 RepID=UPI00148E51C1|nr:uncharacterized protein si:ch211-191i18.2 isoform X2 [Hippoglossus hippoglossus]
MSSLSFLSVYLSGASMILLLTAVSQAQDYDFTPAPDYDSDYNATFEYSFYSNGSSEDLEKFSEPFIDSVDVRNSTSLPVSLAIRTLVWTLMIMISVNLQQLQHTL